MQPVSSIYNSGTSIYSPFSKDKKIFIIMKGFVMAFTYDDDGKRKIHLIYGPGDYFPVITSFKNTPQRASYESLTRCLIDVYAKDDFLEQINTDIDFCKSILEKTVSQLSLFADNILDLTKTGLENKLHERIDLLISQHGVPTELEVRLPYPLTQQQLADMLGVERESISRTMGVIKKKHHIFIDSQGHLSKPLSA